MQGKFANDYLCCKVAEKCADKMVKACKWGEIGRVFQERTRRIRPAVLGEVAARHSWPDVRLALCRMSVFDLIKATIFCGGVAFLFFSYPILGQIVAIAVLSLLWLSYARKTVIRVRGPQPGLRLVR